MKTTTLIFLFNCIFLYSYGQFSNYSFGDVTREELLIKDCPFEPGAPAMVIAERCEFVNENGVIYNAKWIRRRIKILTKEGLSFGNFELQYSERNTEISNFRASVFNLENGIIDQKDHNNAIITNISKDLRKYAVPLPGVKVGSIVDILYQQRDYNTNPTQVWYFQHEIPCGWSEYIVRLKTMAPFIFYFTDCLPFAINTVNNPDQNVCDKSWKEFRCNQFAVENAPSYHLDEPFILRQEDQISKVELVYKLFNENYFCGINEEPFSWNETNEYLLSDRSLGKVLDNGEFLEDSLKNIVVDCNNFEDSLKVVYEFIRHSVKFNGRNSIYANDIQQTMNKKSGSSGEINLLLLAALHEAGFDCHPLILSTSDQTPLSKNNSHRNWVNYLIAAVFKDSTYYLLDASNRNIAFNTLPMKCLNGNGFLVSDHPHKQWLPLLRNETIKTQTNLSYAWNPDKADTVFVERSSYSLSANRFRYIISERGEDEYIKTRKLDFQDKNISTPTYSGLTETENPFVEKFNFVMKPKDYNSTDSYFLQTIPFESLKENPFDAIKRDFRIDFQVPHNESVNLAVKIPEGFSITFIPENISIRDLGGDLVFDFTVMLSPDKKEIWVHSGMQVNRISFSRDEYSDIRQFFAEIVKAQNTLIELKKD